MKLAIFTTETSHHLKFCLDVQKTFPITQIFIESIRIEHPFEVSHPFEMLRDKYELDLWFEGKKSVLVDYFTVKKVFGINDSEVLKTVIDQNIDVIIVFGTSKISKEFLASFKGVILNLHGGNPERYRGLDSHLWSIYHSDWESLVSCLHILTEELDTGDIVKLKKLVIEPGMPLYQLRATNTEACTIITLEALNEILKNGRVKSITQKKIGRYYSAMPSVLKDLVVKKFQKYTSGL